MFKILLQIILVAILTGPFCFFVSIGGFMVANIVGFSWYIILFASFLLFLFGFINYNTFWRNYFEEKYKDN